MSKRNSVTPVVLGILERTPGLGVHVGDIIKETGLTRGQVLSSMATLRRNGAEIHAMVSGDLYVFRGWTQQQITTTTNQLFELVGKTKKGVLIIQDEEGNLFRAEEIE